MTKTCLGSQLFLMIWSGCYLPHTTTLPRSDERLAGTTATTACRGAKWPTLKPFLEFCLARLPAPRRRRLQPVFAARCPGCRARSVAWAACVQEAIVQPDLYRLPLAPTALLPIALTLLAVSLNSQLQMIIAFGATGITGCYMYASSYYFTSSKL